MELSPLDITEVRGMRLHSSDNDEVGEIEDVFLDDQSGRPEWVRLGVGLLGMKNVVVPVATLTKEADRLKAPYSKDMIKDAPRVEEDYISPEQETSLYRYYGLDSASPSELNERRGSPGDPILQGPPSFPETGEAPAHAPNEIIADESLAPKREGQAGRVRLHRWIST